MMVSMELLKSCASARSLVFNSGVIFDIGSIPDCGIRGNSYATDVNLKRGPELVGERAGSTPVPCLESAFAFKVVPRLMARPDFYRHAALLRQPSDKSTQCSPGTLVGTEFPGGPGIRISWPTVLSPRARRV